MCWSVQNPTEPAARLWVGDQPWEELVSDAAQGGEDLFRRRRRARIGQLRRDCVTGLSGVLQQPASHRLAQGAERPAHLRYIHVELRHRQRFYLGPARGVAGMLAGEQVVEGGSCSVALGERVTE